MSLNIGSDNRRHHRPPQSEHECLQAQLSLEQTLRQNCQELLNLYKNTQNWSSVSQLAQSLITNSQRITALRELLSKGEEGGVKPFLLSIRESKSPSPACVVADPVQSKTGEVTPEGEECEDLGICESTLKDQEHQDTSSASVVDEGVLVNTVTECGKQSDCLDNDSEETLCIKLQSDSPQFSVPFNTVALEALEDELLVSNKDSETDLTFPSEQSDTEHTLTSEEPQPVPVINESCTATPNSSGSPVKSVTHSSSRDVSESNSDIFYSPPESLSLDTEYKSSVEPDSPGSEPSKEKESVEPVAQHTSSKECSPSPDRDCPTASVDVAEKQTAKSIKEELEVDIEVSELDSAIQEIDSTVADLEETAKLFEAMADESNYVELSKQLEVDSHTTSDQQKEETKSTKALADSREPKPDSNGCLPQASEPQESTEPPTDIQSESDTTHSESIEPQLEPDPSTSQLLSESSESQSESIKQHSELEKLENESTKHQSELSQQQPESHEPESSTSEPEFHQPESLNQCDSMIEQSNNAVASEQCDTVPPETAETNSTSNVKEASEPTSTDSVSPEETPCNDAPSTVSQPPEETPCNDAPSTVSQPPEETPCNDAPSTVSQPPEETPCNDAPSTVSQPPEETPCNDAPTTVSQPPEETPCNDAPSAVSQPPEETPCNDAPSTVSQLPEETPCNDAPSTVSQPPEETPCNGDAQESVAEDVISKDVVNGTEVPNEQQYLEQHGEKVSIVLNGEQPKEGNEAAGEPVNTQPPTETTNAGELVNAQPPTETSNEGVSTTEQSPVAEDTQQTSTSDQTSNTDEEFQTTETAATTEPRVSPDHSSSERKSSGEEAEGLTDNGTAAAKAPVKRGKSITSFSNVLKRKSKKVSRSLSQKTASLTGWGRREDEDTPTVKPLSPIIGTEWDPTCLLEELYSDRRQGALTVSKSGESARHFGYLQKLPMGKTKAGLTKGYKRRYFRAMEGKLYYYEDRSVDKALGFVRLETSRIVPIPEKQQIQIVQKDGKSLMVKASDQEDLTTWHKHLLLEAAHPTQPSSASTLPQQNVGVVIIDIGACSVRAGFASEEAYPELYFPAVSSIDASTQEERGCGINALQPENRYGAIQVYPRKFSRRMDQRDANMQLRALDSIINYVVETLAVDPQTTQLVLTLPPTVPEKDRNDLVEVLFESYGFAGLCMQEQAILALYSYNTTSGLVVDIGDHVDIIPIIDGYVIEVGVTRLPFGGNAITESLSKLITSKGIRYFSENESYIVRLVKESLCFVSDDYLEDGKTCESNPVPFTNAIDCGRFQLPDHRKVVTLDSARFKAPEGLFSPALWGKDVSGLHEHVWKAIQACPIDQRKQLAKNIYLSGACTLLPGLQERLQKELTVLAGSSLPVEVHGSSCRQHAAYIGASVLASLGSFSRVNIVSREEWSESGVDSLMKWKGT